ncbi:MAG: alpha-L-fucosidase [Bacteroidales bacterium]
MIKTKWLFKTTIMVVIFACIISPALRHVNAQVAERPKVTKEERVKWFLDARFGMMITWGAYSQTGGYWKGVYKDGYAEWLKFEHRIPNVEYDSLVRSFNPVDFNAGRWVEIAKNAGMKYIVLMAKHHDGFALYNSAISDYDIIDMTRFGRDPVGELAAACQRGGIKFGVYYSVDRDWHHPDASCDDKYRQCNFWDYPNNKSGGLDRWHNNYFPNYAVKQVTELVTQYPVDIVWFDGIGMKTRAEVALLDSIVHANRPYCLINSRISNFVGSTDGDYGSKGDNETPNGYQAGGWENPGTLGFSYAWSAHDTLMSPKQAIRNLIEIVSKGGNYLLNVGPNGKGVIVPEAVDILNEMGSWLTKYGTSIYGADGLPVRPPDNVLLTIKPHRLFVHVLRWNDQKLIIKEMDQIIGKRLDKVKKVYMLADDKKQPMDFQMVNGTLTIDLSSCPIPKGLVNTQAEVIVVSDGL